VSQTFVKEKRLLYVGKARSGYTGSHAVYREQLDPYIRKNSPLSEHLRKPKATCVEPVVEAEVDYGSVTREGLLREPVFKGVRDDLAPLKPPRPRRPSTHGVPKANILQLLPYAGVPSPSQLEGYWRKAANRALPVSAEIRESFSRLARVG
jgi:bifunctional non-homologous end joining protein LigD